MIAYNRAWLDALKIKEKAQEWFKKGLINQTVTASGAWQEGVSKSVKDKYPEDFYSPNVFIRIGLFIFGSILIGAIAAFIALLFGMDSTNGFAIICLFLGILCFVALENIVKKHYQSGLDDVFLYAGLWFIIGGLAFMIFKFDGLLSLACLAFPFLLFASIRYIDRLLTTLTFSCLGLIIILFFQKIAPSVAVYILPFIGMIYSSTAYFWTIKNKDKYDLRHWSGNFDILEAVSLIAFYASGNYYVLQQAGLAYFGIETVAMAWLFWIFTFAVPMAYIYSGLMRRDRWMLNIGLICVAASILSYRFYFHIMSIEVAAILGGAALLAIAYFSIKYLNKNKTSYTYEQDDNNKSLFANSEALIIAQSFGHQTPTADDKPIFGGGDFGGGGASDNY